MSQRAPNIVTHVERHEEIFLARYGEMRGWALGLTGGDRERAEDLVHDAFVNFTLARPTLGRIENLDGYLYRMLQNLHKSQLRRDARLRERALPVFEYDSAETSLRAADPRELIRVQDELRACCRYACARKETSKSGSVLILRFFHGYYPSEVASLLRSTREAAEERLRIARNEARQFLKDPSSLRFLHGGGGAEFAPPTGFVQSTDELLAALRRAIFDSRAGACLPAEELRRLYREEGAQVETKTLAHIVSCPRCVDEVNRLLDLAPLSERFAVDVLGVEKRTKDKGDGGDGTGGGDDTGGGATRDDVSRCRRRVRDVFEHRPQALCVTVNGQVLAEQKTGAPRCEQRLSVRLEEGVEFVEVFSEQEVRLLFLDTKAQPAGGAEQLRASVTLSDERTLEATLSFDQQWPTVNVVYEDPLRAHESVAQTSERNAQPSLEETAKARPRRMWSLAGLLSKVSGWFSGGGFRLRPATITAVLALVAISALLLTRLSVPAVSAAELLRRSAQAESALAADAALVLHNTFFIEESTGKGAPSSRRRVEVWQSAARGLKLRRVYDRENNLIAGEWETGSGARVLYQRGAAPRASDDHIDPKALLDANEVWRLDLSARTFSALVGNVEGVSVEDSLGAYVLDYRADSPGGTGSILRATLRLSKADLRATGQTIVVGGEGGEREYRFIEGGFERLPSEEVAPDVFRPDAELLGTVSSAVANAGAQSGSFTSGAETGAQSVASPELEVEVAYLLSRVKADLGEQVTMTRTTGGQLRVEALAETEGRKEEILRALGPVMGNPAVVVDVSTVAERLKRGQASRESVQEVEVRAGQMPADADLRKYFAARIAGDERVERESKEFAERAMARSRRALLHASALKRLVERFTPAEGRALAPAAREKWLALVREHVQAIRRETVALNGELRPVFSPGTNARGAATGDANPARAAERLLELAYDTDAAVRSAFTVSADGDGAARVKSAQFWRALGEAEALAASILAAYEN